MGVHHFFTSPDEIGEDRLRITGPEAHHAGRVLRLRVGETISVADGTGRVLDAVVTRTDGGSVEARIILERRRQEPRPELVLHQAAARKEAMDLVVQKAVEVGARRIVPFLAERSLVRWDEAKREKARERWSAIALAAAKQSRSPWVTEVEAVVDGPPATVPAGAVMLVLHEDATRAFREALPGEPPECLSVVVGPEGGLTFAEVEGLVEAGAQAVSLGERILRTETAGPVALALAAYSYGRLG